MPERRSCALCSMIGRSTPPAGADPRAVAYSASSGAWKRSLDSEATLSDVAPERSMSTAHSTRSEPRCFEVTFRAR